MPRLFQVDPKVKCFPSSMALSIKMAEDMLHSEKYRSTVKELFEDFETEDFCEKTLIISTIRNNLDLDAYGIVYRDPKLPGIIFLNPIMMIEMDYQETELNEQIEVLNNPLIKNKNVTDADCYKTVVPENELSDQLLNKKTVYYSNALFNAIILVHEFGQQRNNELYLKQNDLKITPSKKLEAIGSQFYQEALEIESNEIVRKKENLKRSKRLRIASNVSQETIDSMVLITKATLTDFGNIMEVALFGGVLEHEEYCIGRFQLAFSIKNIIMYPYPNANVGYIVSWDSNIFDDFPNNCKFIRGNEFKVPSTGKRGKLADFKSKSSSQVNGNIEENEKTVSNVENDIKSRT